MPRRVHGMVRKVTAPLTKLSTLDTFFYDLSKGTRRDRRRIWSFIPSIIASDGATVNGGQLTESAMLGAGPPIGWGPHILGGY